MLDRTPFYAESGGQAADAGRIEFDGGVLEVLDVQRPVRGLVVHQVRVLEGELPADAATLHAKVDPEWRTGARQAHSGTHVVHAALREVLGPTALQSGSYNRPGYLRLDFGWTSALSPDQVRDIEAVSNQALRADLPVGWQYMTLAEAKEWGAIALFGETYDDQKVRVVEIGGPWSRELCGGTHVEHSSQIGTVVVTGEASVGSGNRRIEAFTGVEGFAYLARERDVVHELTTMLKAQPDDVVGRVRDMVERLRATEKELERARLSQLLAGGDGLAAGAQDVGGVAVVAHRVDGAGGGDVRTLATDVRARLAADRPGVVVARGRRRRQGGRRGGDQRRSARARALGQRPGQGRSVRTSAAGAAASRTWPRAAAPRCRASTRRSPRSLRRSPGPSGVPEVRTGVRLGIDPGDARIGVARSDPSGFLATPGRDGAAGTRRPAPDPADPRRGGGGRGGRRTASLAVRERGPGGGQGTGVRPSPGPAGRAGAGAPVRRTVEHGQRGVHAPRSGEQGEQAPCGGRPGRCRRHPAARVGHGAKHRIRARRDRRGQR